MQYPTFLAMNASSPVTSINYVCSQGSRHFPEIGLQRPAQGTRELDEQQGGRLEQRALRAGDLRAGGNCQRDLRQVES